MAKILDVVENEEFINKLEKCASEEEAKALWKEYDIEENQQADLELEETELKDVSGGISLNYSGLDWAVKHAKNIWKYSVDFGVICRAYYDLKRYGDATRSYSSDRIFKAARHLGLE